MEAQDGPRGSQRSWGDLCLPPMVVLSAVRRQGRGQHGVSRTAQEGGPRRRWEGTWVGGPPTHTLVGSRVWSPAASNAWELVRNDEVGPVQDRLPQQVRRWGPHNLCCDAASR